MVIISVGAVNVVDGLVPALGGEIVELAPALRIPTIPGALPTSRVAAVELGVVLLLVGRGLLRGSRTAWALATGAAAVAALLPLVRGTLTVTGLLSAAALLLLLGTRRSYRFRPPRREHRWWLLPAGLLGGLALFAMVGYAEIDQLAPAPMSERLTVIARTMLFLPGRIDQGHRLVEAYATALQVGLGIVLGVLVLALRRRVRDDEPARDAVRDFVVRNGRTSTAPLLALPDNVLLPLCSGDALAAVGIRGGVAVCLGGPVAMPGREAEALAELTAYCEESGLTPALLAADTAERNLATAAGYSAMQIGVEAVLDVPSFSTSGKRRSNVRHSVSRARREGVSVVRYDTSARTATRTRQVAAVSEQWLLDKGGPELGFTLGRFDPGRLDDQEVYIAVEQEGGEGEHVVAFVTWLPYDEGRAAVLDLMRRAHHCPPGVMELLVVDSVGDFARRGRVRASLGGVPLATTEDREGLSQRLLGWLYEHGGVYEAAGLFRFKDKFAPVWEPMWLAYPTRAHLPKVSVAALRAFLPPTAVRDALQARRTREQAAACGRSRRLPRSGSWRGIGEGAPRRAGEVTGVGRWTSAGGRGQSDPEQGVDRLGGQRGRTGHVTPVGEGSVHPDVHSGQCAGGVEVVRQALPDGG